MYQGGKFDGAKQWLAHADPNAPISLWVGAKLLLRDGKVDSAMGALARAARLFPANEEWDVWSDENILVADEYTPRSQISGELAALKLSRGEYALSLELLLNNGWWNDAAYVAERVLSIDELKSYIDRIPIVQNPPHPHDDNSMALKDNVARSKAAIRHLLARRLTRVGRWKDARPYFPVDCQKHLDAYINAIQEGYNPHRTASDRAHSIYVAAKIARDYGMELMGTELGPDWATWRGSFEDEASSSRERAARDAIVVPISDDERRRISPTPEAIQRRFHYRYIAADHAWEAAKLLPDNSDELAKILVDAGGWLKAKDAPAADRFYKALIERCPKTSLGRAALAKHWFP
jgi:hypothetical protein